MKKLSLNKPASERPSLATLKSAETSFGGRKKAKERPEYKTLGLIITTLYRLGYKVKWKQPFSKDIYREIREVLSTEVVSSRDLYEAIGYHVKSVNYLLKLRPNAPRYNIQGKKSGAVTADESKFALQQLLTHHADYMRDRRKRQRKVVEAKSVSRTRKPHAPGHDYGHKK